MCHYKEIDLGLKNIFRLQMGSWNGSKMIPNFPAPSIPIPSVSKSLLAGGKQIKESNNFRCVYIICIKKVEKGPFCHVLSNV